MEFKCVIEPADRSVGIMSEGFSAWMEGSGSRGDWCDLVEYTGEPKKARFQWYDMNSERIPEDKLALIPHRRMVERFLLALVVEFYKLEEADEAVD